MYVYVCICMYMYACMYVCMHVCMYVCICMYLHVNFVNSCQFMSIYVNLCLSNYNAHNTLVGDRRGSNTRKQGTSLWTLPGFLWNNDHWNATCHDQTTSPETTPARIPCPVSSRHPSPKAQKATTCWIAVTRKAAGIPLKFSSPWCSQDETFTH